MPATTYNTVVHYPSLSERATKRLTSVKLVVKFAMTRSAVTSWTRTTDRSGDSPSRSPLSHGTAQMTNLAFHSYSAASLQLSHDNTVQITSNTHCPPVAAISSEPLFPSHMTQGITRCVENCHQHRFLILLLRPISAAARSRQDHARWIGALHR